MNKLNTKILKGFLQVLFFTVTFVMISCNSIFSGGTGGTVVNSESTSSPKQGIANVDVYAYISKSARDKDFSKWTEGTTFQAQEDYYAHTSTDGNGNFTISKIVWETDPFKSEFGKDADVAKIYLLFYHENYGLTKGETLIVSDSSFDTVYAELTAVRKNTVLNLNFVDVATQTNTSESVYVKVTVPQLNEKVKVYEGIIAGNGSINISYPRWKNADDKANNKEYEPEVIIEYEQSSDDVNWMACYNEDNEDKNFAFRNLTSDPVKKTIKNPAYGVTLYGKRTKHFVPTVSGQYKKTETSADDGVRIAMKCAGITASSETPVFDIDCGEVSTQSEVLGATASEKHGVFSNLGAGYFWTDSEYKGRYAETKLQILVDNAVVKTLDVRSNSSNYNIVIE